MKKNKIAICMALAGVLAASPTLIGCSGDHYSSIEFAAQDTSYAVTSQGGSAVSYGNYVYFINGTRGYDDTDGKNNVWGEAVKGALYRAEFNGEKIEGEPYATFAPELDLGSGLEFKYTAGKDYFDEPLNVVDVSAIAPKTVGTTGYGNGGIFIYDNNVYFASPNNTKSSTGTVQTTRTDFFMMPLSGGKPVKLYTTSEGVDTSSSAYAFYKYGGAVYLVVNEGGNIVSVRVNLKKSKAEDPVKFEVGATSVYFPVRDTYYNGIDNNTPEDFIYFVRNVGDDDVMRSGTVIEAMRPDGSENFVVSENGQTETIDAVRDGMLFYRTSISGKTYLAFDNLHEQLMEHSPSYKAAHDENSETPVSAIQGRFVTAITSTITATYPFRVENGNEAFFIGVTSSALNLHSRDGSVTQIASTTGTPLFIRDNYLYFSGSSSDFYRVPLWDNMDGFGTAQKLAEETTSAGISCDYAAGYFTYFAKVDEWADGYTMFTKVDGTENIEDGERTFVAQFVGKRASADIPTDDQIKAAKEGESED